MTMEGGEGGGGERVTIYGPSGYSRTLPVRRTAALGLLRLLPSKGAGHEGEFGCRLA